MITASSHRQPLHDLFRSRPPVRRLLHIQVLRMKAELMPLGVTVGVCVFCLPCCVVALYLLPAWNVLQSQPSPARSPSSYLYCFCYSLTVFIKQRQVDHTTFFSLVDHWFLTFLILSIKSVQINLFKKKIAVPSEMGIFSVEAHSLKAEDQQNQRKGTSSCAATVVLAALLTAWPWVL